VRSTFDDCMAGTTPKSRPVTMDNPTAAKATVQSA
jgi:hypothetical protein